MHKYRKEFAVVLSASSSGLTKSRFLRLFFMSLALTVLGLPIQFYALYQNTIFPLVPYSWSRVHGPGWWDIILIPTNGGVTLDRWIQLAVGFTVFVFFGLGHDMKKMYRSWLLAVGFGRIFPSMGRSTQQTGGQRPHSQSESKNSRAYTFMRKFSRETWSASRYRFPIQGNQWEYLADENLVTVEPSPSHTPRSPPPQAKNESPPFLSSPSRRSLRLRQPRSLALPTENLHDLLNFSR